MHTFLSFQYSRNSSSEGTSDLGEALIIAPFYATQPWFLPLLSLVCAPSFILPQVSQILTVPGDGKLRNPLRKMILGVFGVSGNVSRVWEYQNKTATIILSSWRGNTQKQYGNYLKKLSKFCDLSKIDKFQPSIAELLKFLTGLNDSR